MAKKDRPEPVKLTDFEEASALLEETDPEKMQAVTDEIYLLSMALANLRSAKTKLEKEVKDIDLRIRTMMIAAQFHEEGLEWGDGVKVFVQKGENEFIDPVLLSKCLTDLEFDPDDIAFVLEQATKKTPFEWARIVVPKEGEEEAKS